MNIPIVTLTNGLRIANFSSPHTFTFDDGSVLGACTKERSLSFNIQMKEFRHTTQDEDDRYIFIQVLPVMTDNCVSELDSITDNNDIDLCIVPRPVIDAMKEDGRTSYIADSGKFVTGRLKDRINKVLYSNKFCK